MALLLIGQIATPFSMNYAKTKEKHSFRATECSQRGVKGLIHQNWWVVLFIAACGFVFLHFSAKKNEVILTLENHLNEFREEKSVLVRESEDLTLQINSQSDPAWIQLTLMKGLGLVPQGQLKVYFHGTQNP